MTHDVNRKLWTAFWAAFYVVGVVVWGFAVYSTNLTVHMPRVDADGFVMWSGVETRHAVNATHVVSAYSRGRVVVIATTAGAIDEIECKSAWQAKQVAKALMEAMPTRLENVQVYGYQGESQ